MDKVLVRKINKMAEEDRKVRMNHKKDVKIDTSVDERHTIELKKIIIQYGWPTISLVGKRASFSAWLLVQHADHDLKFQENVLKLLKNIDKKSYDIDRANIAYLTDRVLVSKNKKQRFGTQFSFDKKGRLKLNPIENPKIINKLRMEYNLPPIEDFIKMADEFNTKASL